jgi:hypothetical protein
MCQAKGTPDAFRRDERITVPACSPISERHHVLPVGHVGLDPNRLLRLAEDVGLPNEFTPQPPSTGEQSDDEDCGNE